jgi:twitching motility protein PilT
VLVMGEIDTTGINSLLETVWTVGASDLLLTAGAPPLCRIDGEIQPLAGYRNLSGGEISAIVVGCLPDEAAAELARDRELDFSFSWQNRARFRGNAFHQRGSIALALRLIPAAIPTLLEIGAPESIESFTALPQGLVLVTGPTGSGKSTTQAALIDHINETRRCHIVTIEDPIEHVHDNKLSAINQREVGDDTHSFERALRSALREDPDVLLVGEMRDTESIQTALTIAETGHLVFATLHTNDTATALDRIVDVFPSTHQAQVRVQLAACLSGVIAQRLVPQQNGGMVAAFEVLVATPAVRNLIREGKTAQIRNVIVTHQREGMQTLEMALNALVANGVVSYEQAVSRSVHPKEIKRPYLYGDGTAGPSPAGPSTAAPAPLATGASLPDPVLVAPGAEPVPGIDAPTAPIPLEPASPPRRRVFR